MSSATILFVLDETRQQLAKRGAGPTSGISLAFGPGLICEMIQLTYAGVSATQAHQFDETYV
ncbi:hypothetical protein D3C85_1807840 [compost metagenome]